MQKYRENIENKEESYCFYLKKTNDYVHYCKIYITFLFFILY